MSWEEEDRHREGFTYFGLFFFFSNCRNEREIDIQGLNGLFCRDALLTGRRRLFSKGACVLGHPEFNKYES